MRDMPRMTTIAAVIPLHNKARFIERALKSVLSQTRRLDEIIVVDDASTDRGMDIVSRVASGAPSLPFRLLRRPTPGAGGYAARNLAIAEAQSDWIAFLDADDEWNPGYIETVGALVEKHNVGAVGASRCVVRGDASVTRHSTQNAEEVVGHNEFVRLWLKHTYCPFWTSATTIRRDVLREAGLFPERCRRGGDKDLWLRTIRRTSAVLTRFVGATYHNDDVHQVTRRETTHAEHCLVPTLERMISEEHGEAKNLLIRLLNMEIYQYAKFALGRSPIGPEAYRAFRAQSDPLTYLLIRVAAQAPVSWMRALLELRGPH
jgi:succinoglycan biosynthesis protein ExoO